VNQAATIEHLDVLIVGAGISGIAAAVELQRSCPDKSYTILESRNSIGGTWDLFRYPGIRSDSDMFTLGFSFKPWTDEKSIAAGGAILEYLRETVDEFGLGPHIRLQRQLLGADWRSEDGAWHLRVQGPAGVERLTCNFLYMAAGYYSYTRGYKPDFPGSSTFTGPIVHPQEWPENLDYRSKRVVVIGSGATGITLTPAMASDAERVTLVQRSPSYVLIESDIHEEVIQLRKEVGPAEAFERTRLRNLTNQQAAYRAARAAPEIFKKLLFNAIEDAIGQEMREKHFTPSYQPWEQRLCLVPNGDLFRAIKDGSADVVTGEIETFTEHGLRMRSGEEIQADIIVTATGLMLVTLGQVEFTVDGDLVDFSQRWTYKGMAFSGVPNLVSAFGYIHSSWTPRIELVNRYWCEILTRMHKLGARKVTPTLRPEDNCMEIRPWITGLNSGYLQRHMSKFPRQGDRAPWTNPQAHKPTKRLLTTDPEDGALVYTDRLTHDG
jgi:monooxygenase